jgi:hypothetical protein
LTYLLNCFFTSLFINYQGVLLLVLFTRFSTRLFICFFFHRSPKCSLYTSLRLSIHVSRHVSLRNAF